jgi:G:T-mismatch repair DNA endonuclease (very short patch repair protein)
MVDTVSSEKRWRSMSRVKNRDTKPEIAVRRLLHALDYSFRFDCRTLSRHLCSLHKGTRCKIYNSANRSDYGGQVSLI